MIRLRTRAGIKEGSINGEEALREASGRGPSEVRASSLLVVCFHVGLYIVQLEASLAAEKEQVDAVLVKYDAVKEKHIASQTALATAEDLLQTLTPHRSHRFSAQSSDGSGYMGQIADTRPRLAEAADEEEQARVKFDMSRREIGELEKRWKAVEREVSQGERDVKKMQAEVESLRKEADGTGWSPEKE